MILVAGSSSEPMVARVHEELQRRQAEVRFVESQLLPDRVRVTLRVPSRDGQFTFEDGTVLRFADIRATYQRIGFLDSPPRDGWSDEEASFATTQTQAAMAIVFNHLGGLVANRPITSGSNASKPYQIGLIEKYGFRVPRTLVTNYPNAAADFFERMQGEVIYKSTSYVRSIVQSMEPSDLERLETLRNCPVQLQEKVVGEDYRVHVIGGEALFATRIATDKSDYRYDKGSTVEAAQLPTEVEQACFSVTRGLGFEIAGIDLRATADGYWYCFEVNPSPAFTWYEDRTGQPITSALCDLLQSAS